MNLFNMKGNERQTFQGMSLEAFSFFGIECDLYQVQQKVDDLNRDETRTYLPPVKVDILFDDHPKVKLKALGWYTDDNDYLPYLIYVLPHDKSGNKIKMSTGVLIDVPYELEETGVRRLEISEVKGDGLQALYWVCKAVPFRDEFDLVPDTPEEQAKYTVEQWEQYQYGSTNPETGFKYLKRSGR